MNYISRYLLKLDEIMSIPHEEVMQPVTMPVSVYMQEAMNLYAWCRHDRDKLTANGLDWSIVEDMPARIDALKEAQSRWAVTDKSGLDLEWRWKEKLSYARGFRKDLVRSIKFLFRKDREVSMELSSYGKGGSCAAIIQSLHSLSVFGRMHSGFLAGAGFDTGKLGAAADLSREMASLMASVRSLRISHSAALDIRNRAYTFLAAAVSEVRSHGHYLFSNDSLKFRGYTSEYIRRKNRKARNKCHEG
jgi:hypothetical protein